MGNENITSGDKARKHLLDGIEQIYNIVAPTYGCNINNAFPDKLSCSKAFVDIGVKLTLEMTNRLEDLIGDGRACAVILLRTIVKESLEHIAAGANPTLLQLALKKILKQVETSIITESKTMTPNTDLCQIAEVATMGDLEIAMNISKAFEKNQPIFIDRSKGPTTLETTQGVQFEAEYIDTYGTPNLELQKPQILISKQKISSIQEILPLLQTSVEMGSELLIITKDIDNDVLSTLILNKLRGLLKIGVIKCAAHLEDLVLITGAKQTSLDTMYLGKAKRAIITKTTTTLIQPDADLKTINLLLTKKELSQKRRELLSCKITKISIGDSEERKQKYYDTKKTLSAAIDKGTSVGGGATLLHLSLALKGEETREEKSALSIMQSAMQAPMFHLSSNAGEDPSIIIEYALSLGKNFGFNMQTGSVEDLLKAQIIDPTAVTLNALTSAIQTAVIIIQSELLVAHE